MVDVHDLNSNCWDGNSYKTSNMRTGIRNCSEGRSFKEGNGTNLYSNLSIKQDTKSLSPGDVYALIQNSPGLMILDVRTPQEYQSGHLEGAINLDYYSYGFPDSLRSLDKNSTYIIYCKGGVRSTEVLEMMKALGFKEVYNILGGLAQWSNEGLPMI